jgi:hypothetical protein
MSVEVSRIASAPSAEWAGFEVAYCSLASVLSWSHRHAEAAVLAIVQRQGIVIQVDLGDCRRHRQHYLGSDLSVGPVPVLSRLMASRQRRKSRPEGVLWSGL